MINIIGESCLDSLENTSVIDINSHIVSCFGLFKKISNSLKEKKVHAIYLSNPIQADIGLWREAIDLCIKDHKENFKAIIFKGFYSRGKTKDFHWAILGALSEEYKSLEFYISVDEFSKDLKTQENIARESILQGYKVISKSDFNFSTESKRSIDLNDEARGKINKIDEQLKSLFASRTALVKQIKTIKKDLNQSIYQKDIFLNKLAKSTPLEADLYLALHELAIKYQLYN